MSGRTRQCHGCHGPCDASHKGYPVGADRCPLEHTDACEGGIRDGFDRLEQKWRGCPRGYVMVEDDFSDSELYGNEVGEIEKINGRTSLGNGVASLDLGTSPNLLGGLPPVSTSAVTSTKVFSLSIPERTTSAITCSGTATNTAVTGSRSGLSMSAVEGDPVSDQVTAARSRLQAMKKAREELEVLAELQRAEQLEAVQTQQLQEELQLRGRGCRPKVGEAVARLRARNQNTEQQLVENAFYDGLTMPQIRKVSGLATVVDDGIDQVRTDIPSLARRPSAMLGGPQQQAGAGSFGGPPQQTGRNLAGNRNLGGPHQTIGSRARSAGLKQRSQDVFDPVRVRKPQHSQSYVQDLIVMDENVKLPYSIQPAGSVQVKRGKVDLLSGDPLTDPSDEEEDEYKMKLVYRRDQHGQKYRTWEPVQEESPQVVYEWVSDARTGREYKRQVQVDRSSSTSNTRVRSSHQQLERTPTFVSISKPEKEGKSETVPNIVDWARKCPVLWAEKVSHESMNVVVWIWGYLSEILSSQSGGAPSMEPGVLEAKLQHALCVLEVCATHSEKTDFDHHGWKIARLYARKVQAQLDRGLVKWSDFTEFKSNPHPSELIAAKQELAGLENNVKKKKAFEEVKEGSRGRQADRALCTTWNSSKVEGKCDWQANNPDKGRCNRRHDCSYCAEKGYGKFFHQKTFCGKRIAAGDS